MSTWAGTNIFSNFGYATSYYNRQGYTTKDIIKKAEDGEILIGFQSLQKEYPGCDFYSDSDGRYFVKKKG